MKTQRLVLSLIAGFVTWLGLVAKVLADDLDTLPNLDKRREHLRSPATVDATRDAAATRLRARIPGIKVDFDDVLASPRFIHNQHGFLSGPASEEEILNPRTAQTLPKQEEDDPHAPIKRFLNENSDLFGYDAKILDSARISREYVTAHNGMRTVVWEQQLDGIPIFEALLYGHITRNGELVSLCSQSVANPAQAADAGVPNRASVQTLPPFSAQEAVAAAATNITESLRAEEVTAVDAVPEGAEQKRRFTAPVLLGEATASLVWLPMDRNTMRLCWRVVLTGKTRGELFQVLVDAEAGDAQVRHCWTFGLQNASYRVFASDSPSPFSPGWSTPNTAQPPLLGPTPLHGRQLVTLSALSTVASPNGWINDNDNRTIGNNVDAHTDLFNDDPSYGQDPLPAGNPPRPQNANRVFDYALDLSQPPSTTDSRNSAVVNAFYWCNWMHDKLYELGFIEAAGNFQQNNFGRGGVGGDPVLVDVQDNANGTTGITRNQNQMSSGPTDGIAGRMLVRLFDEPAPDRDAALAAELILHEYTHAMTARLVGHGAGLIAKHAQGMNEGWADFYSLALLGESPDNPSGNYPAAPYMVYLWKWGSPIQLTENYYYGVRRYPYSTDMTKGPLTFIDADPNRLPPTQDPHPGVPRNPVVAWMMTHGNYDPFGNLIPFFKVDAADNLGEIWCATLWEARAKLITKYGFLTGNDLILQLVTDGMKLAPPNPTFLEARDAILLADRVLTGGASLKELWEAFAKRGMGWSASVPNNDPDRTDVTEAFDLPPQGTQLWIYPSSGALSGGVYSSPAIAPDGTVYVGVAWPDSRVHALNPDGTVKWTYAGLTSGAWSFHSSPAIGPDGTVYIGGYDTYLYALNPTGPDAQRLKWYYDTGGQIYSSPAIGPDGTIYFCAAEDHKVYALTPGATSAILKWSRTTGNTMYSSPAIGPDGTVYVGSMDNKVYGLDPSNGADRAGWPFLTSGSVYSSPAIAADGTVYVGSYDGKVYAVYPYGTKKWDYYTGDVVRSPPVIGPDGTVYVGSQNYKIYALNPSDGTVKSGWPYTTGFYVWGSAAVGADGTVFFGSYDGKIYALNPDGTPKGSPWPFYTGGAVSSSPAIGTNGVIYVGAGNGKLYALNNVSGLAQTPWPMFRRNLKHTGYDWQPVGSGVQPGESVFTLAAGTGSQLYVGGTFTTAGGISASRVALWNGTAWSALGTGLSDGYASAMSVSGSTLYLGGLFTYAGGQFGPNIGKWTGSSWTTLYGANGPVYAVAVAPNGDVYIGGTFTSVYSTPANNVARLHIGSWQALGSGVNGPVQALAVDSLGQVYVGGQFTTAGGVAAANIAKWADPNWSALSGGTDGAVASIAVDSSGQVFVGGYLTTVYNGGTPLTANGIAKWSAGSWSAVGTGLQDRILDATGQWITIPAHGFALAASGATLYVGGDFSLAGGAEARGVAKWSGTAWEPMGSGIAGENSSVEAVALTSDYIYMGGSFGAAGRTPANGIARWKR